MKRRINILIVASSIAILSLSAIQYYLVKTTYDFKVEEFRKEIKKKVVNVSDGLSDSNPEFEAAKDSIYSQYAENFIEGRFNSQLLRDSLFSNQYESRLTKIFTDELQKEIPAFSIDFASVLNKYIIYKDDQIDTIVYSPSDMKNRIYGTLNGLENTLSVNKNTSITNGQYVEEDDNGVLLHEGEYKLLKEDTFYVSISNWEQVVLKRMVTLLVLAILSVLTVISLFIYALKVLMRQKKISEVKTDFINNITHELKTPLATLGVATKSLKNKKIKENGVAFEATLETIDRQNHRLQKLIDQVLNTSLGEKQIVLNTEPISDQLLINDIVEDFGLSNPGIELVKNFDQREVKLHVDKFHFTTALLNLLENAVKYGGTIVNINTHIEKDSYQVCIEDNGVGIAKKYHHQVFDKFFRVEKGEIHNTKGLGLGLFYVHQTILAHRGTIALKSEEGKGSKFMINIPTV